jgi:TM2 domain-containing membrane protein YozV
MTEKNLFLVTLLISGIAFCCMGEATDYYSPENVLKFADYLYVEGDYLRAIGEYRRYLFYFPEDDTIFYKIGLCYRNAGDTKQAIEIFNRILSEEREDQLRFKASYQIGYSHLLSGQYRISQKFLEKTLKNTTEADRIEKLKVLIAFNYLHQKRWHDVEGVLNRIDSPIAHKLAGTARRGMRSPRKNPLLSGLLSSAVPGAGRVYCGQYGDGVYSFILVLATGLIAWDGFREDGVGSGVGWLFGSISGILYAGNIYGSAVAARVYNYNSENLILNSLPEVPDID